MPKYGLKLWSTNECYLNSAVKLYQSGVYDYIELFVEPGCFSSHIRLWAELEVPYIIHAPHFDKGVNLASRACLENNLICAEETIKFADRLKAETIIFHPGIEGDIEETVRQLKQIADPRIVIENKPRYGHNDMVCVGSSPEEIEFVMTAAKVGFCLDVSHAICAANACKTAPMPYLEKFLALQPRMFHLTDGDFAGIHDRHDHFGRGDYDIGEILRLLPRQSVITVETDKEYPDLLDDFAEDVAYLKRNL
jgi:deoxyribonuclease-4